jgi:hypothetical protein
VSVSIKQLQNRINMVPPTKRTFYTFADGKDIPDEFIIKILDACNQDLNRSFEELQDRLAREYSDIFFRSNFNRFQI